MSNNQIYHIGPCYCSSCNDHTVHRLHVERPFMGVGPTTPYNIWMVLIKRSRVVCSCCGKESKPNDETKSLFEKLKKAKLIDLNDEAVFQKRLKECIKQNDLINNYSNEKKNKIISMISLEYSNFNIPREWFENYFSIMLAVATREDVFSNYLYR